MGFLRQYRIEVLEQSAEVHEIKAGKMFHSTRKHTRLAARQLMLADELQAKEDAEQALREADNRFGTVDAVLDEEAA